MMKLKKALKEENQLSEIKENKKKVLKAPFFIYIKKYFLNYQTFIYMSLYNSYGELYKQYRRISRQVNGIFQ